MPNYKAQTTTDTITYTFAYTVITSATTTSYGAINGNEANTSSTETTIDTTTDKTLKLVRVRVNVRTNSHNGNTIIAFRDDGVSIGSLTIGNATTGQFDSGALSNVIAIGSLINWILDHNLSSSGSSGISSITAWLEQT